jgi:hypothetical protein
MDKIDKDASNVTASDRHILQAGADAALIDAGGLSLL